MKSSKTDNPVHQLELLRSFVRGCRITTIYTEKDLVECLRQSGYNVQRAAELLITEQYCPSRSLFAVASDTTSENKRSKSAFFRSTSVLSPARKKEANSSVHVETSHNHLSTKKEISQSLVPRVSMTPTPLTKAVAMSSASARKSIAARKSIPQSAPLSVPNTASTLTPLANGTQVQKDRYLLCRRWISDAIVTCRTASIRYREALCLDYTQTGYSRVGFRSARNSNIRGKLPDNIAILLSPLLRFQSQEPLVDVVLESMMDDSSLVMGSSIPIQITIFLTSPRDFFELMIEHQASDAHAMSASTQYFAHRRNRSQSKKKSVSNLQLHEAAFLLLQWAQYGDVPEFETQTSATASDNVKSVKSIEHEVIDIKDSQCTPSDSENNTDDSELQELNEEDFESESTESDVKTDSELASSVEMVTEDSWTSGLPDDIEDPIGFTDHVSLRSYQKQALYFMMQRETEGMNRDHLDDQLQLLEKLVAEQHHSSLRNSCTWNPPLCNIGDVDVMCDCGPVLVSENGKKKATTLNGATNPISHPLWQRRYLASPCFTQCVTFFVNELLGTATYIPPEPPQHCSGGILADAMGLGKTVMLLALILKSKESHFEGPADQSPKATLVIAKLSLLSQWEEELKSKTNLTYKIFYGSNTGKPVDTAEFLDGVDVVVTTYGTVQSELRQKYPVLQKCQWLRVILDEAHCIRNQRTLASKATCSLSAKHRWCVSGTIIQNSLDDVYGIMKFLRHEPWCLASFWKTAITQPFQ